MTDSETAQQEWALRCDLAALYRLLAHFRMTDLIYTHLSVRIPGPGHRFLINEYGRLFHKMRASDLVAVDAGGEPDVPPHESNGRQVNAAGFTIHSAIHMARPDVACVIHTHTSAGIAVSCLEEGLLPISQHALKFYGRLSYHGYEGVALDLGERDRLVEDLGSNFAMVLRNHGLLTCGRTVAEAFHQIYYLERACQAQVAALQGGRALVYPPEEVRLRTAAQFQGSEPDMLRNSRRAWDAALQLLEGEPDWRC